MARNHARVLTAIWSDAEFTGMTPEAQRMYLLLLSQPDLTPCGALPYIPRRWARLCPGTTVEAVEKAIEELEESRFLLVDRDTDELAIRTFVVHDGGLANPKMRGAVKSSLGALHSRWLRSSIAAVIPCEYRDSIADGIADQIGDPIDDPIASQSPMRLNAEVGGRRQEVRTPARKVAETVYDDEFDAVWSEYPRKEARKPALSAYRARRREGVSAEELARAVSFFGPAMASRDRDKIMLGSTFFGPGERWKDFLEPVKLQVVSGGGSTPRRVDHDRHVG